MNASTDLFLRLGPRVRSTFNGFIGQSRNVALVGPLVTNAMAVAHPCKSMLLIAPTGHGKTYFARATARLADAEGKNLREIFAAKKITATDLVKPLLDLRFSEFLFVDEAHALTEDAQRLLFRAVTEFVLSSPDGDTEIAPFTLILATTEPGKIGRPLRNRLTAVAFEAYTRNELTAIARAAAEEIGINVTAQAASVLGRTAQGTPRTARHRVELLPDVLGVKGEYGVDEVRDMLKALGIDSLGLNETQRRILEILSRSPDESCTFAQIRALLGFDQEYIRHEIEPYLFQIGFVDARGGRGRHLLDKGRKAIEVLRSEGLFRQEEDS